MTAHPWLAVLGVLLILVAGIVGLLTGLVDRVLDDPETKATIERERARLARQKAWKDRLK